MKKHKSSGLKKVLYIYGAILLILVVCCIAVYITYNNKIKESAKQSLMAAEKLTEIVPNSIIEEASIEMSKTIEQAIQQEKDVADKKDNIQELAIETNTQEEKNEVQSNIEEVSVEEPVKRELKFIYPVEGEIVKEFSMEKLIFSETLQEWIVHKGIDIKAPRTSVVRAAEEGIVKAIKNDPRYGLTIVLEHVDGYKTIYSNLLTTEFVVEGENVTKGQSLGTVGNSAAFEIADEPHLHFELLRDEENVDPRLHIK